MVADRNRYYCIIYMTAYGLLWRGHFEKNNFITISFICLWVIFISGNKNHKSTGFFISYFQFPRQCIMELPGALLSQNSKNKKNLLWKNILNFLKKAFLIFRETGTSLYFLKKVFLISRETEIPYISGSNFPNRENKENTLKKLLIFRKVELFSPKLNKPIIFQERVSKAPS